jgi:hypothetical protein
MCSGTPVASIILQTLFQPSKATKKASWYGDASFGKTLGTLHYFPQGSIYSETYTNLLEKSLLPLIDEQDGLIENLLGDRNLIFQQDNAPIHTSKKTLIFLEQNGLKTLSWPANSPDLNPIENLWHTVVTDPSA